MKLRVLRSVVFPTAAYGCCSIVYSKNVRNRIIAFENKGYRKILNVHWSEHRTNESVYQELGVRSGQLLNLMKRQKLKYFGHTLRHDSLEKLIMQGRVEGSRRRGRPRRRWMDDVVEWLEMGAEEAVRLAADRKTAMLGAPRPDRDMRAD